MITSYMETATEGAERVIRDVLEDITERIEQIYNRSKMDVYDKKDLTAELGELLEDLT